MGIFLMYIGCVISILGVVFLVFWFPFLRYCYPMREIVRKRVSAICECVGIVLVVVGWVMVKL